MPRRVAVSGPIVEPQGRSARDTKCWYATPASAQRADYTIEQNWEAYTPEEHAVWSTLFDRLFSEEVGQALLLSLVCASLATLGQQPGMGWVNQLANDPAFANSVEWQRVQEQHQQWAYSQTGMGPVAAAVVSLVVGVATAGAGAVLLSPDESSAGPGGRTESRCAGKR